MEVSNEELRVACFVTKDLIVNAPFIKTIVLSYVLTTVTDKIKFSSKSL